MINPILLRLTIKATCNMNLANFPMDDQLCTVEIESFGYTMADLRLVAGGMSLPYLNFATNPSWLKKYSWPVCAQTAHPPLILSSLQWLWTHSGNMGTGERFGMGRCFTKESGMFHSDVLSYLLFSWHCWKFLPPTFNSIKKVETVLFLLVPTVPVWTE